jgi:hypothetical protein
MTDARRRQIASLSFAEKLKILEKLRARSLAIAAAGLRLDRQDRTSPEDTQQGIGRPSNSDV